MMYKIAYIDEDDGWLNTFYQTFKRDFDVHKFKVNSTSSPSEIIEKIFNEGIDAIVTDYLLEEEGNVSFNGNRIVDEVRNNHPYFPVIMLTSYENQAINHMDDVHIIYGKSILDGESDKLLEIFKTKIQSNILHYQQKIENTKKRIETLSKKKNETGLDVPEEDELARLFITLDELEPESRDLPISLIVPSSISKLHEFVAETKELLRELKDSKKARK